MKGVGGIARVVAIAIAVLGVIDPAITTNEFARAPVALVHDGLAADDPLLAAVRRTLEPHVRLTTPGGAAAAATVIVGARLPAGAEGLTGPLLAVVSAPGAALAIEAIEFPRAAQLGARVEVGARLRLSGLAGDSVRVTLRDGVLAVAETTLAVSTDDAHPTVRLATIVSDTAPRRFAVGAAAVRATRVPPAAAEAVVEVISRPWPLLSFDSRPAWMGTFVRRALEGDPRFAVASRVMASRGVALAAGDAPVSLSDASVLGGYSAVVVGAPVALTASAVAGLERYLRVGGGRVILLLDEGAGGPWRQLLPGVAWREERGGRVLNVVGDDGINTVIRASTVVWPGVLPLGAEVLASVGVGGASHAVVWRLPVGAGEVIVSGALDAWQFRDDDFERFWRGVASEAAASNPGPLAVSVERPLLAVGDSTRVEVTLRSATVADAAGASSGAVAATLERDGGAPIELRLWPEPARGTFSGVVRAREAGMYRLTVRGDGATVTVPLLIDSVAALAQPASDDLLARWIASAGGVLLSAGEVQRLPALLEERLARTATPLRWHPMRSPWWLVPFALLLGAEWWLRRRRGAP